MKAILITFDQVYYERIIHNMDVETPKLGLRAFVWNIERSI